MNRIKNIKQLTLIATKLMTLATSAVVGGTFLATGVASAATGSATTSTSTTTANQQLRLQNMITKGDQEINRRLTTLSTLTAKINAATKLTPSDQAALTSEVSSTISGLQDLETQLNGETTVSAARTDVQNIYSEYRVYALVAPKVSLIKVADDQQTTETKLTSLSQKLQARITADQQAGKDVSSEQTELSTMTSDTDAAQTISSGIESSVIGLQPTDYNSNHALLSGDNTQLKTAHSDLVTAFTDARTIVSQLKTVS